MTTMPPEFSRPVPIARLGREALSLDIEASAEERAGLCRRFGLLALDRLWAAVSLRRRDGEILLEARIEAEFVQECIVSLEPVPGALAEAFELRYGPGGAAMREIEVSSEEATFEPLAGDAIDIGEAVAQELSLALPLSPRHPDAVIEGDAAAAADHGPFAALRRLARR